MAQRFYLPIPQIFTDLGVLAPGWKLYFYQTGTTTPLAVYSDTGLSVQLPNPVLTNDEGHLVDGSNNITSIYFSSAALYKAVLKDENDIPQWTADPCDPNTSTLATLSPRPVYYAGLTTGTSTAYVLVANPTYVQYASTDTFELTFHTASGANPTLQYVSGGAALNLKKYYAGTKISIEANELQNQTYTVRNDGTDVMVLNLDPASTTAMGNSFLSSQITLTYNDSTHLDFSSGVVKPSDGTYQAKATGYTKILQNSGSWTAGTGQNGLFTGARTNSTWYHCFAIIKTSDRTVDFGFDTSATAANIPSGYSKYQRVGSIQTDGSSNIISFYQTGTRFYWTTVTTDVNTSNPGTSAVLRVLSVPVGITVIPLIHYSHYQSSPGGDSYSLLTGPAQTDSTPSTSLFTCFIGVGAGIAGSDIQVLTNTSSQIRTRNGPSTDSGTHVVIMTYGWIDNNL